ncbi:MAG: hypothetical protein A3F96_00205 [Parcubacteria group bacterium RIFCSPLOWO2_12_FULL_40_10]|nr:MAG: hypothetical protein A3D40_01190 [Parcubacteria group bacterium RIFCSPHIGHO2_02_FULL_40_12]OHB23659.1 MAG: hypothetical protein A3I22_01240 [Parcubacteria group bacterium RIFCSPLOWO2_02_FULL_40_12]OHB24281.1 MAG: hypothetical protein A3F96_00205 [Parcubacteria group bacterium RIFCSPLOWO2_12_FULL_40_10]
MPELELLPEKTQKIQVGPKENMWPVLSVLIIILALYGGLLFYNQTLKAKVQNLDATLINFNSGRNRREEDRINEVNTKLSQAQSLLGGHIFWSRGFQKIQQLTLPSVRFIYITASVGELKFEFRAIAPNLTAVAKQGANFLADDSIQDISINQIKVLTNGQTEFGIKLTFNDQFFR